MAGSRERLLLSRTAAVFICACLLAISESSLFAQNIIITIAGNGEPGDSGDGGLAIGAELFNPKSVCLDAQGNMYIADQGNNVIRKVVIATGIITTIAGTGTPGYYGDGGKADTAEIDAPAAVFADDSGNLYIADWGNDAIRKVIASDSTIITVAGTGDYGYNGDSIAAIFADLWAPSAIYVDKAGNIYIADTYNSRIRKVDMHGIITTIAGDTIQGYSGDGGLADTAELYAPYGVTGDTSGNIYISDGNSTIRKVSGSTGIISTIAGSNNNPGYSGDSGPAVTALIKQPLGICLDDTGNLYIADYYNDRVRVIHSATGIITTIAGTGDTMGSWGDGGLADTCRLNGPTGVFVNNSGFLFIADNINDRIREVGPGLVQATGINALALSPFQFYPNPAAGLFTITGNYNGPLDMTIYTTTGQEVYQRVINSFPAEIDVSNLPPGIYFLRFPVAQSAFTGKLVVVGGN